MLRLWNAATGVVVRDLPGEASALAFSPDGKALASGDRNSPVRLWSPRDESGSRLR